MRILLVALPNSGSRPGLAGLYLPLGLAYISACIGAAGHQYDCVDLHNESILDAKAIDAWERISCLDLSAYDAVAYGGTFLKVQELNSLSLRIKRERPNLFQLVGGNMATNAAKAILLGGGVNCVCLHEGEHTIVELLNALPGGAGQWQRVPGLMFRDTDGKVVPSPPRGKIDDLDAVPFPDRNAWSFNLLRKAFPYGSPGRYSAVAFASRGCPFNCSFCCPTSGRKMRVRSPENIVAELKLLRDKWNVRYVRFFDEIFIGSQQRIRELCEIMIKEKLDIFWWCQTQVKLVDEATLQAMCAAGCIEIGYGIESGCDMILREMNKGITREQGREAIELTYRQGIIPALNLIAGFPSETVETLQETRDFIVSMNHIPWTQVPRIDYLIPIPGTRVYEDARRLGKISDEEEYIIRQMADLGKYSRTINLTAMSDETFYGTVTRCNREISDDFFRRHPWKRCLSLFGLDHLRCDLLLRHFSASQVKPLIEAVLWATLGKRNHALGRAMAGILYGGG